MFTLTNHSTRHHFDAMSKDERARTIRRLAAEGMTDHMLANATGLAVEQIRQILANADESSQS